MDNTTIDVIELVDRYTGKTIITRRSLLESQYTTNITYESEGNYMKVVKEYNVKQLSCACR